MTPQEILEWRRSEVRRIKSALRELGNVEQIALSVNRLIAKSGLLQEIVKKRFAEQATGGVAWPALSRASVVDRHRMGFDGTRLLERSGVLRGAAENADAKFDAFKIDLYVKRRAGPRYIGSGIAKKKKRLQVSKTGHQISEYAWTLSNGGPSGGVRKVSQVPARPFFGPVVGNERKPVDDLRDSLIAGVIVIVLAGGRAGDALKGG